MANPQRRILDVPFSQYLPLRIGDLLITELRRQDEIDKKRSFKLERTHPRDCFERGVKNFGPEKHRLFSNINNYIKSLIPKCASIQALWSSLYVLVKLLNENVNAEDFKSQAQQWVKEFRAVYQTKQNNTVRTAMAHP